VIFILKEVIVIITAIITFRKKSKRDHHLESRKVDHILPLELADGAVFVAEPMLSYLIFIDQE
jgi:hypothetical protein